MAQSLEAENSDLRLQLQHSKPLEEDYEEHGIINILLVWYMLNIEACMLSGISVYILLMFGFYRNFLCLGFILFL